MSWLRAIFDRLAPAPAISTTAFGRTIEQMAAADDAAERARLGKLLATQLEGYLSGQAGNTFVALLELEERIRQGQGETNDMIGEAVGLIRGQGAALLEVRADFQAWAERVTSIEATVAEHAREIASFRQSRDASIEERRRHSQLLEESAAVHERLAERDEALSQQIKDLSAQLTELSAALSRREVGDGDQ